MNKILSRMPHHVLIMVGIVVLALLEVQAGQGAQDVYAASKAKSGSSSSSTTTPPKSDISGNVTQSYSADPGVLTGMIVEIKQKDATTVVPLPSKDIRTMLGVVLPIKDATIVITPQNATTQQVLVATSGRYNLLVSNQAGAIKIGDYLTISALSGIGMKASANEEQIVGRAASAFDGKTSVIGAVPLKTSLNQTTTVTIGRIQVDLHLAPNPLFHQNSAAVPGVLAKTASSVANKPVNTARIYIGLLMLVATIIISGTMFYGGVRSGIIAVGRNPLAKKEIIVSLVQTIVAGLIVFVVGVFAVYLILKL